MKYQITQLTLGCNTAIEITAEEFRQVKTAREKLFEVLFIEEKVEYVIANYRELELECLNIALEDMTHFPGDWSENVARAHHVSRRIANFLATCKMYVDHISVHILDLFGRHSKESLALETILARERTAVVFTFVEELRNYVQHCDLPIHGLRTHTRPAELHGKPNAIVHFAVPQLVLSEINPRRFDSNVLTRTATAFGDAVDLRKPIREYMDAIGRIHLSVREMCNESVKEWDAQMADCISRFRTASGESSEKYAEIVMRADEQKVVERFTIFEDFITRRKSLIQKNFQPANFAGRYVTGQLDE